MDRGTGGGRARGRPHGRAGGQDRARPTTAATPGSSGFSPRFLAAVWVGYDDNRGLNLSGTQAAVPIFADFSKALPSQYFAEGFPVPSDIVTAEIDPETGFLATPRCPAADDGGLHRGNGADDGSAALHRGFLRTLTGLGRALDFLISSPFR